MRPTIWHGSVIVLQLAGHGLTVKLAPPPPVGRVALTVGGPAGRPSHAQPPVMAEIGMLGTYIYKYIQFHDKGYLNYIKSTQR